MVFESTKDLDASRLTWFGCELEPVQINLTRSHEPTGYGYDWIQERG